MEPPNPERDLCLHAQVGSSLRSLSSFYLTMWQSIPSSAAYNRPVRTDRMTRETVAASASLS
jgi:hypothetical protein